MAIPTNGLQLVRIAGAVFNQQLSATDYSEILTANKSVAELNAWANSTTAAEFKGKTTTDIAKAVLTNVGLSSVAGLEAWLAGQLTAGGGVAKAGETMLGLLNDFSNMSLTDATYGSAVMTFNTKAAASQALSLTAGTATGTYAAVNSVVVNTALTLTSAVQTSTGTAGDDTFTSATGTLNAGDVVNGGAGTDTLNATISGTAPTQSATSLVSIEVLNLTSSPNAASIDLTGVTGLTSVNSLNSANIPVTASNIGNVVNSTMTGSSNALNVGYTTAAVLGTADTATLTLSGVSTGSSYVTSGIETLTVNSSGTAANTLTTLTDTGITGLVITGSQGLTITGAVGGATITSVNASAATGAVTVTSGNGPSTTGVTVTGPTAGGAFTATTGSGRDTFTITAGASTLTPGTGQDTLNLGSGVDTVRYAEVGVANADTINNFSATDVIAVNLGQAQFTSASGVITLASANAAFGTVQSGATTPTISGVNGAGTAATISFQAIAPGTAVTATTNVLALTGAFTDGTAGGAVSSLGTSANTGITTTAGGKFLLVTYSVGNIAQVWSYAGDSTSNTDIDTAELSLVATLNGVAANSLTAANFATYLTPATASSSANTTVGNTFTVTAANALVTPLTAVLAAPLTSTMTGFNDTVNGSNFAGVFVQDDSTTDADVYNTLVNVALAPTLVNVETVNATMAGNTLTTTGFTGVNTISVSGGAGTVTTAATTMPTIALASGYASTLTVTPNATGNAINVRLDGSATGAAISSVNSTALTINTASASSLSGGVTAAGTITLTGAGALTLGAITTATVIAGTAMTGALTQTAIGSLTVNSGSGADVLTLVAGTSVLNTGAGNDTFSAVGGVITSADTLNGGAGTDTISITGNTAVSATDFDGAVSIEAITVANTTTNVAITTVNALVDAGATLTVTASTLTTGTLTFNGALETNGFFNITGGAAIDTITGGANADTITPGLGADVITGGGGNDTINLAESTASIDKVVFSGGAVSVVAQFAANGTDTINGWGSTDTINVAALGDGTTGAAATDITAAATQGALTDDRALVISTTGAAANLTTSGTAVITDFTNTTQVAAYLTERFTAAANTEQVFIINNTASGANQTFIYTFVENGTANSIVDIELALVGIINNNGVALTSAANVVFS